MLAAAGLVAFPTDAVAAAKDGVQLCLNVIVPSLLPFFVLSSMVVELGLAAKLGRFAAPVTKTLFNVGGASSAAFVLGFIGGYPVGAKTAIALYKTGQSGKAETERLLAFCNNSGPAFILGVVGAGVFSSGKVGVLLCLVHALASVLIGIGVRFYAPDSASRRSDKQQNLNCKSSVHTSKGLEVSGAKLALSANGQLEAQNSQASLPQSAERGVGFTSAFVSSVKNAVQSALNISGFVIFFTVFIRLLFLTGALPAVADAAAAVLPISRKLAEDLLKGLIELTSGVSGLASETFPGASSDTAASVSNLTSNVKMAAFMLGWAGLSVHCQALSFICDSGLKAGTYIAGKLLHGILSAVLVTLLFRLVPFSLPASAYLTEQVQGIAALSFGRALSGSALASAALLGVLMFRRKSGTHRRDKA
jgi:sporulation integral membrane protein YlbJ